jgi:S-formylglutathione hydrolase FrmB
MRRGRIVIDTIDSLVLRGNPLGDPCARQLALYLPPGYDESDRRYPSVYVRAGFNGRGTMLLNDTPFDDNMAQRMDRLIDSGAVQPMIVVMPDCLTRLGGSQYINSSATGRYEDHLTGEIVTMVDRGYRTVDERGARAVVGKSSGGYGALMLALRHPQLFGMAASHSGDLYFELCYKPAFVRYVREIGRFGGLAAFLRDLRTIRPRDAAYHELVNTVAMAACYSPNPDAPHGFELPFDPATGEIDDAVWQRWLAWDPVHLVASHAEALRSLRLLYLDAGSNDEFNLQLGARIFCGKLRQHGVPFQYQEFEDAHMNIPYRFDASLTAISDAMI